MEEKNLKMAVVGSTEKVDQTSPASSWMKSSLYVGDLDEKVSSTDLFHVFSQIGKVSSVHLCVDAHTGDSLRYGYVNFLSPLDATRALSSLNHTKLKGKPMRVMWCQRNPYPRRAGASNLFVKNLDPSVTSTHLQSMFQAFGNILSCKVVEENGKSKCFGFVYFEDEASVDLAINAMNDKMLGEKKLYVARFMNKQQRISTNAEKFTNLYVKNLDEELTDNELKEKFSEFGTVHNAVIMRNGEGKSKGFGFINFESTEEAKKAVEALNGAQFGSKKLFVGRAQKKAERAEILKCERDRVKIFEERDKASNVYVKHLHPYVDDKILAEHFSPCGKIVSAKVMCDNNGISKGFGFVRFSSPSEARVALLSFQGSVLCGKPLFVALAMQKQERQKALKNGSYFMQFPYQGVKPIGSVSPLLLAPSRPKAVEYGFRGFSTYDSVGHAHNTMEIISKTGQTISKEYPYNLRAENLQAGCSSGLDRSFATTNKMFGLYV